MNIQDSGERRIFESGAVRDITDGKGRCDLIPLDILSQLFSLRGNMECSRVLAEIHAFMYTGDTRRLLRAVALFSDHVYGNQYTSILEVAKHYQDGCSKYGEHNWEKGIPVHCFIDSGVRHLLKYFRGDSDEAHDRAFVWNMLGAAWTTEHLPDLADLPFNMSIENE